MCTSPIAHTALNYSCVTFPRGSGSEAGVDREKEKKEKDRERERERSSTHSVSTQSQETIRLLGPQTKFDISRTQTHALSLPFLSVLRTPPFPSGRILCGQVSPWYSGVLVVPPHFLGTSGILGTHCSLLETPSQVLRCGPHWDWWDDFLRVSKLSLPGTAAHGLACLSHAPSQGPNVVSLRMGSSLSRRPESGSGQAEQGRE